MNIVDLAEALAEIARMTTDPATAEKLLALIERLMTESGLPPEDEHGGGMPPHGRLLEPVCGPA